jgi:hypothetical protein
MGYTHYYHFKKNIKDFNSASKEVKTLLEEATPKTFTYWGDKKRKTLKICGGNGEDKPVFGNKYLCFNGERYKGLDYEGFFLDGTTEHQFCKTARQPYDVAVCLALLRLKDMYGDDFEYSSDGYCPMDTNNYNGLESEWKKAVRCYVKWCVDNGIHTTLLKMKNLPKSVKC